MQRLKQVSRIILQIIKTIVFINGLIFSLMIVLSFTDLPYLWYHRLGTALQQPQLKSPDYIVLMGAGGMPGPQSLLRCSYAALVANKYPESQIIIALPADTNDFLQTDHQKMIDEIVMRGIEPNRIISETAGTNTFLQATHIMQIISDKQAELLIITSPEHMYRSILTFRKIGFQQVNGIPAFEGTFDDQLLISEDQKDNRSYLNAENYLDLRYNMWNYLQYQIIVMRELTAISYYKLRGYI